MSAFWNLLVMSFWTWDLIASSCLKILSTRTSVARFDEMSTIESLPFDIISITLHTLDYPAPKSLCSVSQFFRFWMQPLLFRKFQSSFDQEKTSIRLQAFGNALKQKPSLYKAIRIIDIIEIPTFRSAPPKLLAYSVQYSLKLQIFANLPSQSTNIPWNHFGMPNSHAFRSLQAEIYSKGNTLC